MALYSVLLFRLCFPASRRKPCNVALMTWQIYSTEEHQMGLWSAPTKVWSKLDLCSAHKLALWPLFRSKEYGSIYSKLTALGLAASWAGTMTKEVTDRSILQLTTRKLSQRTLRTTGPILLLHTVCFSDEMAESRLRTRRACVECVK